ncbi:thymidine kinase [Legionella sp. W05-934-2]|uniref:thymidine kinase n=1 Tax=Legionella sp. W05-934-2 TaxID=1198649 RepID=UPI003462086E
MAKLYFYYSAMNAGKSTVLLQSSHNYQERGMQTLLLTPKIDNRFAEGIIHSRIGLSESAYSFSENDDLYDWVSTQKLSLANVACVLIDEAQFLSKRQVTQLCDVTDKLKLPVLAYGLRTDFLGELFEGSQYLLAWADELVEIKTICHCGSKATMNLRIDENGKALDIGEQLLIGGNDRYVSTCRRHFKQKNPGHGHDIAKNTKTEACV